jgi:tetratricopeptide (TPR) repeat protein
MRTLAAVTPATPNVPQILDRAVQLTARGDYAAALPVFATVYKVVSPEAYPKALSSFGLCLSRVQRKNKLGAELCEQAMLLEPANSSHRANLVRLYAAARNRRKAIEVLEKGLRRFRLDPKLLLVRDEIGYRQAPYLRSLRRTHPLNKIFSRCAGLLNTPLSLTAVLGVFGLA